MSTGIVFEWDSKELSVWRGSAIEAALTRALRLAGNQAIRTLRKGATTHALGKKALRRTAFEEDQALRLPTRAEAIRDLVWTLYVRGKPAPAAKFPHVDTRRLSTRAGVLVQFGPGQRRRLRSAFEVQLKSGHVGIFQRTGKRPLPIEEVFSSRLPKDYGKDVMLTYGDPTYRKLQQIFEHKLKLELDKLRSKGDV